MPSRRRFLAGTAVALGVTGAATACESVTTPATDALPQAPVVPAAQSPANGLNFVVILADDLGYGELGAYGQKLIRTPNIDALAAEGLRFTDAYAAAPVCAPSRCSLFTGLHSGHATVRENPWGPGGQAALTDRDFTFAEALRARGYRTALVGKWGFGPEEPNQPSHPNARGFDEFYGYISHRHAHDYYPPYLWRNAEREAIPDNEDGARRVYAPDLLETRALDFMDAHKEEAFLLCLTPTLPHAPSRAPEMGAYGDSPWPRPDKLHAAQVSKFDSLVGNVTKRLESLGIADRTVVIVTSDNGPHEEGRTDPGLFAASGGLRGLKRNLYEGGIRVPLIAWSPKRVRSGVTDRPTPLTDLLPTLAELAGAPAPADVDGLSIAPLLRGGADSVARHDHLYFYRNHSGRTPGSDAIDRWRGRRLAEALRRGDMKAVRFAPGQDRNVPDDRWEVELYDLARDPGERDDIADKLPGEADALVRLMRSSWAEQYERKPFGVSLDVVSRGDGFVVTATLANGSAKPWTGAGLELRVPGGWSVQVLGSVSADFVAAGGRLAARWMVTPTSEGGWVSCVGTARHAGVPVRYAASAHTSSAAA